ncbi:ADC synthase [Penicillium hispanicum]|uniref:ADC synthase n=1 Tax=Penicillium hispanicum TaxID=1080232 RepID=UPI00254100EC|nr:ADC synthase [Penicillium hispanicum]KAJ5584516.1 ADC synthase [Penicillium hispanicum]
MTVSHTLISFAAGCWYIDIGSQSSLLVSPDGQKDTISSGVERNEYAINDFIANVSREFLAQYAKHGRETFGYALALTMPPTVGAWHTSPENGPVEPNDDQELRKMCLVNGATTVASGPTQTIDTRDPPGEYTAQVEKALAGISEGKYSKVISSRQVQLQEKVDMPATLLCGRRSNDPARSFSFNHSGSLVTSFSPELVMSVRRGQVITEPLAGTRSRKSTEAEVNELRQVVEDLMSMRPRGSLQHLGSRVAGHLSSDKNAGFRCPVPFDHCVGLSKATRSRSYPAPGAPAPGALFWCRSEAGWDRRLQANPRPAQRFSGQQGQWVQADAGVIAQSKPERELTETQEKLESVAPFLVKDLTC